MHVVTGHLQIDFDLEGRPVTVMFRRCLDHDLAAGDALVKALEPRQEFDDVSSHGVGRAHVTERDLKGCLHVSFFRGLMSGSTCRSQRRRRRPSEHLGNTSGCYGSPRRCCRAADRATFAGMSMFSARADPVGGSGSHMQRYVLALCVGLWSAAALLVHMNERSMSCGSGCIQWYRTVDGGGVRYSKTAPSVDRRHSRLSENS
jgi:hypothetical protein